MSNSAEAVVVSGPAGQAQLTSAPFSGDLPGYVQQAFTTLSPGAGPRLEEVRRTELNGLDAAPATVRASSDRQAVDVTVFAFATARSTAYHFVVITPAASGVGGFASMINSFHRLSASEAGEVRTREIDIVTVRAGDTVERLAQGMAFPKGQLERFLVLNGIQRGQALQPGSKVKLVIYRR